jgi:hypothetical protein
MAVAPGDARDYHNYPRMIMDDTGSLIIIYADSPNALYMSKSSSPHTIMGNWSETKINDEQKPTYPCILK